MVGVWNQFQKIYQDEVSLDDKIFCWKWKTDHYLLWKWEQLQKSYGFFEKNGYGLGV